MKRSVRTGEGSVAEPKVRHDYPDCLKEFIIKLWERDSVSRGLTQLAFLEELVRLGYPIGRTAFQDWLRKKDKSGSPSSNPRTGHRQQLVSPENEAVLRGKILDDFRLNKQVSRTDVVSATKDLFDVKISQRTASRYLNKLGFSYRLMQAKTPGYTLTTPELKVLLLDWVGEQRHLGNLDVPRSRIASIDFTFTGHRTTRTKSFAPKGARKPKLGKGISAFTNCIVTCIWADGINRTPSVLFTYNSAFDMKRPLPKKKGIRTLQILQKRARLTSILRSNKISRRRICYISTKGKARHFVSEKPGLIRHFFRLYGIRPDSVMFSDNGNSLKDGEESVLSKLGFSHHVYPADVHQYLSPNDNNLHGAAKRAWRTQNHNFSDDVKSCISLLRLLDKHTKKHSKRWFKRNILHITKDSVDEVFKSGQNEERDRERAESAYIYKLGQKADFRFPTRIAASQELSTELNGSYYAQESSRAKNRHQFQNSKRQRVK